MHSTAAVMISSPRHAPAALHQRLLGYDGVRAAVYATPAELTLAAVLAMHFRKGEFELRLFTTIATLGIPQDITLQELRVECFFPNHFRVRLLHPSRRIAFAMLLRMRHPSW
jgi:hypothetical protein